MLVQTHFNKLLAQNWETPYGHVWNTIEIFFQCIVQERVRCAGRADAKGCQPAFQQKKHLTVLLPSKYSDRRESQAFTMNRELTQLFNISGLKIARWRGVPACSCQNADGRCVEGRQANRCCESPAMLHAGGNVQLAAQLEMYHGGSSRDTSVEHWRQWRGQSQRQFLHSMRQTVWKSVGAERAKPDTIVFASNLHASNGRGIANETGVALQLEGYFARRKPQWKFRYVALQEMEYADEIRLMRRTRLLITLFGSAQQNCRFLPQARTAPLPDAEYLLLATRCLPLAACHSLLAIRCLPLTACHSLPAATLADERGGRVARRAEERFRLQRLVHASLAMRQGHRASVGGTCSCQRNEQCHRRDARRL